MKKKNNKMEVRIVLVGVKLRGDGGVTAFCLSIWVFLAEEQRALLQF